MPDSKIKNIVLALLLAVNLFLLAIVVPALREQRQHQQSLYENLQTLFAGYGVSLDPAIIPEERTLYPLILEYDADEQLAAAEALLGAGVSSAVGTGRYTSVFSAQTGSCRFVQGADFSAELTQPLAASGSDLTRAAQRLLNQMGFVCAEVADAQRQSAGIYTVTATQAVGGVPAYSAQMTLTYSNGSLTQMTGVFYTGGEAASRADETACIACADALLAFFNSRDALGWVGSEIVAVEQGYVRAQTASASTVRLDPVWRVQTDTGTYYVNGTDGTVSAAE